MKAKLLDSLTNMGQPMIFVEDANHANRGELLLVHQHAGVDLDRRYVAHTMHSLHRLWTRPVLLHTRSDGKGVLLRFDGSTLTEAAAETP